MGITKRGDRANCITYSRHCIYTYNHPPPFPPNSPRKDLVFIYSKTRIIPYTLVVHIYIYYIYVKLKLINEKKKKQFSRCVPENREKEEIRFTYTIYIRKWGWERCNPQIPDGRFLVAYAWKRERMQFFFFLFLSFFFFPSLDTSATLKNRRDVAVLFLYVYIYIYIKN